MLVSLATIAVIFVISGLAYSQLGRAITTLQSFLLGNRFSDADVEILRILMAAFAPSFGGLLLAFFARRLPDDGKQ